MHLALGNGEFVSFKVRDFAAYERQTRRRLVEIARTRGATPGAVPRTGRALRHLPVERAVAGRRRHDDDLSLIAGMTKGQRRALKGAGIATRRGFAARPNSPGWTG